MKRKITLETRGCDDSTYVNLEMTDAEIELLKRVIAAHNAESNSRCQPILLLEE